MVFVVAPHKDRTLTPETAHTELATIIGLVRTEDVKTFTHGGHFMMYVTWSVKYVSLLVLGALIEKISGLPWVRYVRVAPLCSETEIEDVESLTPGDFF